MTRGTGEHFAPCATSRLVAPIIARARFGCVCSGKRASGLVHAMQRLSHKYAVVRMPKGIQGTLKFDCAIIAGDLNRLVRCKGRMVRKEVIGCAAM